jgi:hypothetical protein
MSNSEFDWTIILPPDERKKLLDARDEFFGSFPTREEYEQAGREGREAFARARAEIDQRRISDLTADLRKLQDIIDNQADRILDLRGALQNILEARDDNQPAALNMPDLEYARSIIKIIHREARRALAL